MTQPSKNPQSNGRKILAELQKKGLKVNQIRDNFFEILNPGEIEGFRERVTVMLNPDNNTLVEVSNHPVENEEESTSEPKADHVNLSLSGVNSAGGKKSKKWNELAKARNVDIRKWAAEDPERATRFVQNNPDHPKADIIQQGLAQYKEEQRVANEAAQLKKWVNEDPAGAVKTIMEKNLSLGNVERILLALIKKERADLTLSDADPIGQKKKHAIKVREESKADPQKYLATLLTYNGPDRLYILEGVLSTLRQPIKTKSNPNSVKPAEIREIRDWANSESSTGEQAMQYIKKNPESPYALYIRIAFEEAGKLPLPDQIETETYETKPALNLKQEINKEETLLESEDDYIANMKKWAKFPWAVAMAKRYIQEHPWSRAVPNLIAHFKELRESFSPEAEALDEPWFEDDKTE